MEKGQTDVFMESSEYTGERNPGGVHMGHSEPMNLMFYYQNKIKSHQY
jgi:hypothetical protein